MPSVTALEPSGEDPRAVVVLVDGQPAVTIDHRDLDSAGIGIGVVWDDASAATARRLERVRAARRFGERLLTSRMMSEQAFRERLASRGFDDATVDRVAEEMLQLGLLDDRACSESVARVASRSGPAGRALLERKLAGHGIDGEIARDVVDATAPRETELDRAIEALKRRVRTSRRDRTFEDPAVRRRLYAFLMRRGFDAEIAADAMGQVCGSGSEMDDDAWDE